MEKSLAAFFIAFIFLAVSTLSAAFGAGHVFSDEDLKRYERKQKQVEIPVPEKKTEEKVAPTAPPAEPAKIPQPKSKSFNAYFSATNVNLAVSTNPSQKAISLSMQVMNKLLFACYKYISIAQNGKETGFLLGPAEGGNPVFTPQGWDGCGYINAGVTRSATLSSLPDWFDFSQPFTLGFHGKTFTIE